MMKEFLTEILRSRLSPEQWAWLERVADGAGASNPRIAVTRAYSEASRRVGKVSLSLTGPEKAQLEALNPGFEMDHWGADEAARAVLLLSAVHIPTDAYARLVLECYELGDSREQQSWLRAVSLLPEAGRFVNTAIDACRTNILPMLEAIACENPYPAQFFPELNFNQMVIKCLFNRISLRRIVGLRSRENAELSRIAVNYESERRAAGRDVPPDIGLAIGKGAGN